jgi:hypothetical protein
MRSEIPYRYRKHLFLLNVDNETVDCRRVTCEGSAETNRRVKGTAETQQETGRCAAAPRRSGSDQEGRMKRVQFWR